MCRLLLLIIALGLSACGGMRIVDSEVRSFGSAETRATMTGARFHTARLPSQQDAAFDAVVLAVEQGLQAQGLQPSPADQASLTLHITWRERALPRAPWEPEPSPFWGHFWLNNNGGGAGLGWRVPPPDLPWFERELHLVLRRNSDQSVVFETQARHDGRWRDTPAVLPAMVRAALQDFPQGRPETRTINIDIPR